MSRIIEYSLEGNGWAVGAINLGGDRFELNTSYIIDTLSEMTNAILAICEGRPQVSWDYFHEPASTRIVLKNIENQFDMAEMTVTRYADLYFGPIPINVNGELLATNLVPKRRLVSDIIAAGTRMLDEHGEDGYQEAFRRPFPTSEIEMLKDLRRSTSSPI